MSMDNMNGMAMMHMTFFLGKHVVMLFDDWPNGKLGMYILALAFVFFLAIAVELLSDFRIIETGSSPIVGRLVEAMVYGIRMALAYLVMLSVMSYNLGVFISAVLGHVIGYFLASYRAALKAKNDSV